MLMPVRSIWLTPRERNRFNLSSWVRIAPAFHGQRGEVGQRYRKGQEDQLGALSLVANVLVLWNTLHMDTALADLRKAGAEVRHENVAWLSLRGHEHINVVGCYSFALADHIAQWELRPLHHPNDGDDLRIGTAWRMFLFR
jgi:hypothetical protein